MQSEPSISVLIPSYNRGRLLAETLTSLIGQSYPRWEAIVVDDGSTDNSDAVGADFAARDNRIRYIKRNRQARGAPTCRNIAFENATAEFVMFLDADDLLLEHCLQQRIDATSQFPDVDFWVFPMLMFRDQPANANILWNKSNERSALLRFLELDAVWQTSGPLWRRSAVISIGGFTESLACWQDVDFHLKALSRSLKFKLLEDLPPDVLYRMHESGSISQGEINSPAKMQSRKEIFFTHTKVLAPRNLAEVNQSLKVLGSNVTLGAVKAHNNTVANECLKFGKQAGIFDWAFVRRVKFLQLLFALRLNRISPINSQIQKMLAKERKPSSIGKYLFKPNND